MRKTIVVIAMTFVGTGVFAQDLTSKKGEPILPEAGDWAIGIDATPFFRYFGNLFGGGDSTGNKAPSFNFQNNVHVITGKYFQDAQTAFRGGVRLGLLSRTNRMMVDNRALTTNTTYPLPVASVENEWKRSTTAIGLSVGIEKRKGKTRLQGFYGAELGFYVQSSKDKFSYGNTLNPSASASPQIKVDAAADAFPGANNTTTVQIIQAMDTEGARIIERKNGTVFGIGVRGFIGVEYFILPKISLGGEFGWGIGVASVGKTSTVYESTGYVNTNPQPLQTTIDGSKQGSFTIDTDNSTAGWGPSGSIRLNFHF